MLLIKIKKNGDLENIKKNNLDFLINNKNIDKLHIWKIDKNIDYILYGCIDGKAGKENKYELPPPLENSLFFDDLYLLKYKNEAFCDLSINEYNKIMKILMVVLKIYVIQMTKQKKLFQNIPATENLLMMIQLVIFHQIMI